LFTITEGLIVFLIIYFSARGFGFDVLLVQKVKRCIYNTHTFNFFFLTLVL